VVSGGGLRFHSFWMVSEAVVSEAVVSEAVVSEAPTQTILQPTDIGGAKSRICRHWRLFRLCTREVSQRAHSDVHILRSCDHQFPNCNIDAPETFA